MKTIITSIVLYQHHFEDTQPTLTSLLASPLTSKIILVDNGGCSWATKLNNPRIAYLATPRNGGFGYGHNLAIRRYAPECDLFLICNPDISFDVSEYEALITEAQQRPEGLLVPKIVYPDGSEQYGRRLLPTPLDLFARRFLPLLAERLDRRFMLLDYDICEPSFIPFLSGSFMLFKSPVLLALGGFDERYFMYLEDIDLSRRCAERFGNCYLPDIHVIHAHQQASYRNPKLRNIHIQSAIHYFNKWGWLFDGGRRRLNRQCLTGLAGQRLGKS
ncbi:glycosyltransferase family 2 protein [Neisseria sp.]|uniref:glycosyltransferase family 2 protein n=1 Tax=Neisseria sp. TaxID=192066 RepID=UPI00289AAA42|nr:glycosyltransferase family 2 protein [Neisseria sp.]